MLFSIFRSGLPLGHSLIMLAVFIAALLMSLIPHEIAHGFAAWKMGDPSAKIAGRLSPNPSKHIDPFGLLSFCIAGIGWAKPVPVNPFNYKNFRQGNFVVSIAGIAVNFILGFISSFCLYLVYKYGAANLDTNLAVFGVYMFLQYCTVMNISLMIFNLLPVYPLDGYNVLVSFTKPNNRFMRFMRENSIWVLLVLMAVLTYTDAIGYAGTYIVNGFFDLWGWIF